MSIDASQRSAARIAGVTLIFGFVVVVFGQFYLGDGLLVPYDAVKTAGNILAHETRYRLWAAGNLLYVMDMLVLISALYVVLKPVGQGLALGAAFLRLVYAFTWVYAVLNMFGSLNLLADVPYLKVIDPGQLQALAKLHLRGNFDAYYVGLPFFALASTLCAWLWLKSGYIPKALAWFGILCSAWGVACGFIYLVFPHFNETVNDWLFDTPLGLFELALGSWLLIKGLKPVAGTKG
jgi:hypothetical protein